MQRQANTKSLAKLAVIPAAVALFFAARGTAHAQGALAVNLGPASFSTNWGAPQGASQYQPQAVQQRSYHARNTSAVPARQVAYVGVDNPQVAGYPPETQPAPATEVPVHSTAAEPTVPGNRAVLRWGVAYAPANAPLAVKKAIWAINTIRNKPYVWGGGHDSFFDPRGYDCSGTVSFALHYAGQLSSPSTSQSLMSFGAPGPGRWMTVYARDGHTWMVIAGLRLDTTGFYGNEGPRWRADGRSSWGFTARHPVGL